MTARVAGRAGRRTSIRPSGHVLVLGGSRSGKSAFAEQLAARAPDVTYLATGPTPSAEDAEWAARVELHRQRRPGTWATVESTDVTGVLASAGGTILLDCWSTWLAAAMDAAGIWNDEAGAPQRLQASVESAVAAWASSPATVIATSSEVGAGVVPATASGRLFRDELGRLNAALAARADEVWFCVAGLPRRLKPETSR